MTTPVNSLPYTLIFTRSVVTDNFNSGNCVMLFKFVLRSIDPTKLEEISISTRTENGSCWFHIWDFRGILVSKPKIDKLGRFTYKISQLRERKGPRLLRSCIICKSNMAAGRIAGRAAEDASVHEKWHQERRLRLNENRQLQRHSLK